MSKASPRDTPFGYDGAPRPVHEILVTSAQKNEISLRLSGLVNRHIRAKAARDDAEREISAIRAEYEREFELALQVGCVDIMKHPRAL